MLSMLWLLLGASVVLPVAALFAGSYFIWQDVAFEAAQDLRRRADIAVENATRVFETHELILRTLDRLTEHKSDDELKAREADLHRELAELIAGVPQIWDVFIWGADGQTLVSGRVYPVPPTNVADRDYFQALRAGSAEPYISQVMSGRLNGEQFFAVTGRRVGPRPEFNGAIGVSIDPGYFEQRWVDLGLGDETSGTTAALLRADGTVLARAPPASSRQLPPNARFLAAMRSEGETGRYADSSAFDGRAREFFFRRVPKLPLYLTTSISSEALHASFVRTITPHLWFGVPATVLLTCFVLLAIRRTVETQAAVARANTEQAARARAERVIAHAAKLESIGRLAAGLAHDFNNILAATIGGIDLSLRRLRTGRSDEVEPLLNHALQAARRGGDLTRQLLAFARGADGPTETIRPDEVINDVAALLPPLLGPAIRVQVEVEAALWPVRAPRAMLESALMNLAVNAKDAMPDGGVITLRARNLPAGGSAPEELRRDLDWVRVAVSDNGAGFPEEVKAHAFEPFVTTKEVGRGTGLGLAQVYGGARQAGGTARIEEGGVGATVALYLPRGTPPAAAVPELAEAASPLPSRLLRVLLVDDDRLVQATSALCLRDAGHEVLEAEHGQKALEILRREPDLDVLVVDYAMPGMNGATLVREARALRPALPTLMVSGQANLDSIDLPADVTRLPKPFTPDDLVRAVNLAGATAPEVTA